MKGRLVTISVLAGALALPMAAHAARLQTVSPGRIRAWLARRTHAASRAGSAIEKHRLDSRGDRVCGCRFNDFCGD
jgi:hypothetical protein